MLESVHIVGTGRVGSSIAARLSERGVRISTGRRPLPAALTLLCVPDSAIAEVARTVEIGSWVAHVSGATRLAALAPHERRFSVHPLQTFVREGGPEQLDGAWAAISAETGEGEETARWLAWTLGLRPFLLADANRPLYHAGAAIASNYLVTLYRAAARALEEAGAPPEALVPLMRRTIDNGFVLTGPISRGDWATVDAHLDALHERAPELEALYRALAEATRR